MSATPKADVSTIAKPTDDATWAVLHADQLTRYYTVSRGWLKPKAVLKALDGVSFTLSKGHTLAVVGESGCGKSTLARQLTMIETPTAGTLWVAGERVALSDRAQAKRLRPTVQMIFQNPFASLNPRKKIAALLAEPLIINTALSKRERAEAAQAMLLEVGLRPEHGERYPHMFSGGQRQRIAVARALMLRPAVVVADEPVSALDVSIQAQVLNLLMDLQQALGLAYVFISHNLDVVRHIADDVLVMYLGKAVEQGAKRVVFERALHPYTQALLASTPRLCDAARGTASAPLRGELPSPLSPPSGCAFHRRCPYVQERCRIETPLLRDVMGTWVACHFAETIKPVGAVSTMSTP